MNLFALVISKSRGLFITAMIAGALSGLATGALIALVNRLLTQLGQIPANALWLFIGLCLIRFSADIISRVIIVRLSQAAVFDLRILIPKKILESPLLYLEKMGLNRLLAILTEDIQAIAQSLVFLPNMLVSVLTVIVCMVYLGWLSTKLMLIMGLLAVVGVFLYKLPANRAFSAIRLAREYADTLMKHFHAVIEGIKELKMQREKSAAFMDKLLVPTAENFRKNHVLGMSLLGVANNWGQILIFFFIGMLLFVFSNRPDMNNEIVTGFLLMILFLSSPIGTILLAMPMLGRAGVSLKKIELLTNSLSEGVTSGASTHPPEPQSGSLFLDEDHSEAQLELKQVAFTYKTPAQLGLENSFPKLMGAKMKRKRRMRRHKIATPLPDASTEVANEDSFSIGPLDLTIRSGELVFLIGGNGSGKTTLVKVITGLYPPDAGRIILNGKPVDEQSRQNYRALFSVVFQDFFLFDRLLGIENDLEEGQAKALLSELKLDQKLKIEGGHFSNLDLSRGQRKRLSLLSAYLEERPFYVFDEWAADQDPIFKEIFYTHLLPKMKASGKTVLVISHDEQYHHIADRIIKMDYGQIEYDRIQKSAKEN